jgi:hypothetical protein
MATAQYDTATRVVHQNGWDHGPLPRHPVPSQPPCLEFDVVLDSPREER